MQPRQSFDTCMPVLPNFTVSISTLDCTLDAKVYSAAALSAAIAAASEFNCA
jgi:hypothetical protein